MEENLYEDMAHDKIASFDHTYSTDHIRMLKICLHYIPASYRKNLSIYIKFMELQHTLSHAENTPSPKSHWDEAETIHAEHSDKDPEDTQPFTRLLRELLPFCNPREKQQFQNMENMMTSMDQLKSMMEMMEMMKDMEGFDLSSFFQNPS